MQVHERDIRRETYCHVSWCRPYYVLYYHYYYYYLYYYLYLGLFHFPRSRNYNVIYMLLLLFDIVLYCGENRKTIRTRVRLLYEILRVITLQ